MTIAVCWKWIGLDDDERWSGVSAADQAALEVALALAEPLGGHEVVVVTVGSEGADRGLRDALAAGADRVLRIAAPVDLQSPAVASAIATAVRGAEWVLCGDYSPDRGSGSVPAYLAAELGAAQALGLVAIEVGEVGRPDRTHELRATRRLDGGRRELLGVHPPAVLSVEGSVAQLRRASLTAELRARNADIPTEVGPIGPLDHGGAVRPYRPRPRVLPAPQGDGALARIRALTDAGGAGTHGETVALDPPEAADRIVAALHEWGYLPHPG